MSARPVIAALTPDIPDETMLTTRDVAGVLAVSRTTAYELLTNGTILGAVYVGAQLRLDAGTLRAWLRAQRLPKGDRFLFDIIAAGRRNARINGVASCT